ncbi:hypothetical protein BGX21_004413 [Mortierella sp. AD011]|nr:hypothetical protein BGX20_010680 [Mortierella sp. AD010]KAF9373477.1 hypothetical protein BGX21_004413 [Mortierella sp. AD011]
MTAFRNWTALFAIVALFIQSTVAHMALLYPMPRGGVLDKKQFDGKVHAFIGFESKRTMPCNGYNKPGPVTHLKAGETINVRFWGPALPEKYFNKLPPIGSASSQYNQARHDGGTCQFSLSYDNGKTFHLIGQYTKSCPDFYYDWPVKIPEDAPSCEKSGQCLFVWSWTAANVDQFYINCADVTIAGKSGGKLNKKGITIDDVKGYKTAVAPGDAAGDKRGKGPIASQVKANKNGVYSL